MTEQRESDEGRPFKGLRRALATAGIVLLLPSGCYFVLGMLGLVLTEPLAVGASSGLRTIASVAVMACLLAAVGYWDE